MFPELDQKSKEELELELIQTHMTQMPVLWVEVGKGRLCGLFSLGDSTSIYCFSALKQQKTVEITPDQKASLFLVKTAGTSATRFLIVTKKNSSLLRTSSSVALPQEGDLACCFSTHQTVGHFVIMKISLL
jgi:hypothetical protein